MSRAIATAATPRVIDLVEASVHLQSMHQFCTSGVGVRKVFVIFWTSNFSMILSQTFFLS
jgi:hypothetical protein